MSTTRNGGPLPTREGRPRVAPRNDSRASSSPLMTSGRTPSRSRHCVEEGVAVGSVAGGAGGHHADALDVERRDLPGVLREGGEGAGDRLGGEPAGGVDALAEPDDSMRRNTSVRRRRRPRRRPAAGSSWCRSRSPRPASRLLRRPRRTGRGPPRGQQGERLVAERVDPGPDGERVGDQHVQALDPVGHAAGAGPLGQLVEGVAAAR